MIHINAESCNGCGACVEVCPVGALSIVQGTAVADALLCRACEACLLACPASAISITALPAVMGAYAGLPALRPAPEVVRIEPPPAPEVAHSAALPALVAAVARVGQQWLPRVVEVASQVLQSKASDTKLSTGSRHRRRRGSG
jgi:Fe-S-cluster-containing hydrogenase component 2